MGSDLVIVTPVFNDWDCLPTLINQISDAIFEQDNVHVLVMNDGSTQDFDLSRYISGCRFPVSVVDLKANLGHQRAISLGLVTAARDFPEATVIVLDSDGEDRPGDIPQLLRVHEGNPQGFTVAARTSRNESRIFRLLYRVYKGVFRMLTGMSIDFGNFVIMGPAAAVRLTLMPESWNSFPGALLQSKLPIQRVPLGRGTRYSGTSHMNLVALVNHGLATLSAFTERVFVRLMVFLAAVFVFLVAAGITILAIRIFSALAIPGWTSTLVGLLLLGVIQVVAVLAILTLMQISSRTGSRTTPSTAALTYLR